ncbi:helix-turn-helix domain-containing protein [Lacticaseibacillus mingshuiensis]|uniref:helix-turn-helix domain-containing protein n=1 Tax=Lacticaseibacillus mingshuiensis TaxID=2799574 RepID=UPI001940BC40|nr:helix-turn-helix transcriptional regulator [Lacticaseibacillus mingshuiensis]
MTSFAGRLNSVLQTRNITKAELARRTGIGRNSISDYTSGKYEAKQDNLYLIARTLEVNEAWLMGLPDMPMDKPNILSVYQQLRSERQKRVDSFAAEQLVAQQAEADNIGDNVVNSSSEDADDETKTLVTGRASVATDLGDGDAQDIGASPIVGRVADMPHGTD